MKHPSATTPSDKKWATRLEKLLAGGFSETVLEATVFAPNKTELFKCPGVLEAENGEWVLRLFRRRENKRLGHFSLPEVPDNATYGPKDCLSAVLQFPDHTEAIMEGIWPTIISQSGSNSWYHETRHRAHLLTTKPQENPLCRLHPDVAWTESHVHGFIAGVELPYTLNDEAKFSLKLPVIGERSNSRSVWSDQRGGWAWLAVEDDRGLAIHLKDNSGLSENKARANYHALTLALGFVMGRQLRYCYAAVEYCGKESDSRALSPPEGPGGTILLPLNPSFASKNPNWTYNLVRAAYDFLSNQELAVVRLATNCMLQVYRSAHPVVPTDTKMVVLCAKLEKLVNVLACASQFQLAPDLTRKREEGMKEKRSVKRHAKWRHVAGLLDISWENGMEPVYHSWEQCRHALAHGDPDVFANMQPGEAFRHIYRLQGGFNALLAGIFRCNTVIRISPMEADLEARVRLSLTVTRDQEWEHRIVTALNAVTPEKAGYREETDLE